MPGHGGGLDAPMTGPMAGRRLPIGIQTFRKMREEGCYYVDKTAYVERLLAKGAHYFLSRPRRFGKSLFLDTLKEFFEGNQALFAGLYIHDRHDWSERHPVVATSRRAGTEDRELYLRQRVSIEVTSRQSFSNEGAARAASRSKIAVSDGCRSVGR